MQKSCFIRIALLIALAQALGGCASYFPTGDITAIVASRNAAWITTGATSYSVYGGYGSACAHSGAHVNFTSGNSYVIYSALDAVVADVQHCEISGTNDKYTIKLAVAMKGPTPVYLNYEFEPFGGKKCTAAGQPAEYFDTWIFVKKGDRILKSDRISLFTALGTGAHVHLDLQADGATICPEIFSPTILNDATLAGPLTPNTCGGAAISPGTLCTALTPSEDPGQVFQ